MAPGVCNVDCSKPPTELSPEPDITGIGVGVPFYSPVLLKSSVRLTLRRLVSRTLLQLV
jgi:hypothetical protein